MASINDVRKLFQAFSSLTDNFEQAVEATAPFLNDLIARVEQNKEANWMMVFDTLYWDWGGYGKPFVSVEERDRIAKKLSPVNLSAVIQEQKQSADEWATALKDSGLTPMEAIGGATQLGEHVVAVELAKSEIASHPSPIALPQLIVNNYRRFYRASRRYKIKQSDAIRPLAIAKEAIRKSRSTGEALRQEVAGTLCARMNRTRGNQAVGRWVISSQEEERHVISEFAGLIVFNLLEEHFLGDKSRFSSREIELIEDACWMIYCLEQDKENQEIETK